MTWFLPQDGEVPDLVPQGPDRPLWSFGDTFGAAFTKFGIEANVFQRRSAAQYDAEETVLGEVMPRLGTQAVMGRLKELSMIPDTLTDLPTDALRYNPKAKEEILRMARDAQIAEPESWNGIDLSQDRIDRLTNEPLLRDLKDAEDIIAMSPNPEAAQFLAGAVSGFVDPRTWPFLLAGGPVSGSALKFIAREAALNMAAEVVTLQSQYEVAEQLDLPDPDVRMQLLMAAAGGVIFGGAVKAGERGLAYFRNRSARVRIPGATATQGELVVDAAENAILRGEDPFGPVSNVMEKVIAPPRPREPLIPVQRVPEAQSPLVPNPIEERRLPPVEGQAPEPIPNEDLIGGLEESLGMAKAADRRDKKPLVAYLRSTGKSLEPLTVHPQGTAAAELKARGITPKSAPGLFSNKGRKDFDNLVATEMEDMFPGIWDATGTPRDATYLDSQGFLDVLTRDLNGDSAWLRSRADVIEAERRLTEAIDRDITASDAFLGQERAEGGFFVDLNDYQFSDTDWKAAIQRDFDAYLQSQWEGVHFSPEEKAEMLTELQTRGGDAGILVERMAEREGDEIARPREDLDNGIPFWDDAAPAQGAVGSDASGAGRSEHGAVAEGQGTPRAGTSGGPLQEQFPGTERVQTGVDQRNRAEISARQQQSMIRRLDQTRVEDDAGGLFGGAQRELFDDPTSPKSQEFLDSILRDLEDEVATDDSIPLAFEGDDGAIGLMTDDGRPIYTVQDLLDEIRDYDMAAQEIAACRIGGANDPV